jgi:hypothetical protein
VSEVKHDEITGQYEQAHPTRTYPTRPAHQAGYGQEGRSGGGGSEADTEEIFALDVEEAKSRIHAAISPAEIIRRIRALRNSPQCPGVGSAVRLAVGHRWAIGANPFYGGLGDAEVKDRSIWPG